MHFVVITSIVSQHFKYGDMIEVHNGFDFYTGMSHMVLLVLYKGTS